MNHEPDLEISQFGPVEGKSTRLPAVGLTVENGRTTVSVPTYTVPCGSCRVGWHGVSAFGGTVLRDCVFIQ